MFAVQLAGQAKHVTGCPFHRTPHLKALIARDDPSKYRTQKLAARAQMGEICGGRDAALGQLDGRKTPVPEDSSIKLKALANR